MLIILVSSNQDLTNRMREALTRTGLAPEALVVAEGKTLSRIRAAMASVAAPAGAVIVDLTDESGGNLQLMKAVKETWPHLVLAAAHANPSTEMILAALRSGASEFLSMPFDLAHLVQTSGQSAATGEARKLRGKLVCVQPAQSGSGASTVALHAAQAAARGFGEKSLLIELDFHSSVLRQRLKMQPKFSLADLLDRGAELDGLWSSVVDEWGGFDVLPAPASSRAFSCKSLHDLSHVVSHALARYRVVVVDLPSPLMSSSREVLSQADEVYVVCTPEMTSLHLARRRISDLIELGISQSSIRAVINRAGTAQRISTQDIGEILGLPVHFTIDNDYVALRDTWERGELLSHQSRIGRQLFDLGSAMAGLRKQSTSRMQPLRSLLSVFQ